MPASTGSAAKKRPEPSATEGQVNTSSSTSLAAGDAEALGLGASGRAVWPTVKGEAHAPFTSVVARRRSEGVARGDGAICGFAIACNPRWELVEPKDKKA